MEGLYGNDGGCICGFTCKNKQLMTKANFLNQAESLMSESYISQRHDNSNKKTRKRRHFILGVMKRKIQEKN